MPRLGELLVATKLLTQEQVDQALRAQVVWGGRLGTNLIELAFFDLDTLSQSLGRQHKLPAALARHFEKADPKLQRMLTPEFADRLSVIPLMRLKIGKIVVAAASPLDAKGIAIVGDELAIDPSLVVVSIAAELRIRYQLERIYQIPRSARFLRAGKTGSPFPQFDVDELSFDDSQSAVTVPPDDQQAALAAIHDATIAKATQVAAPVVEPAVEPVEPSPAPEPEPPEEEARVERISELIDVPVVHEGRALSEPGLDAIAPPEDDLAIAHDDEPAGIERRKYLRVITDEAPEPVAALGRIAIRRVAITTAPQNLTLGEATRAIRRSTDRDKVAELVLVMLEKFIPSCEAAIMLVLRGDVAVGWKGYCRGGAALPEIAIPLDQVNLVSNTVQRGLTVRAKGDDLGPIDQLLVASLGSTGGRDLVVVPVTIGGQVMLAIALIAAPGTEVASAESIAAATGAAFSRLMRDAGR